MRKKGFFAKHAKSSAALVSLGIHAVLIVVALSFVAVSVITKEDQVFESKPVNRPKMQLKKLQVPVNIKKKSVKKPKLRKRIVVQPKMNQTMPDIKMPEITGVKGGLGNAAGGLGGAGGIGFSMPEINIFGVKGRGEKIFIILDSTPDMMVDEMGGIPSYTLIKDELVKILDGLNPTVLFNIAVYDVHSATVLFPGMVSASDPNVAKVKAWLDPLNAVFEGMGDQDYGTRTLGRAEGSKAVQGDFKVGKIKEQREWIKPIMMSMEERADAVFLLSHGWGRTLKTQVGEAAQWSESKRQRWNKAVADSNRRLKEENAERRSRGQAPRVFKNKLHMVRTYYPSVEHPPFPKTYHYTADDMAEAIRIVRSKSKSGIPMTSGVGRKRKDDFTVNVVHFMNKSGASEGDQGKLKQLAREFDGKYRTLAGFEAIKGAASAEL